MIFVRSSDTVLSTNRFLLCVSSPMLHKMISGSFQEGTAPHLALEDVDASVYSDVMDLWNGSTEPKRLMDKSLDAVMTMASVADRLLMTDVVMVLEEAIISQLSVSSCVDVLISSVRLGLGCVEAAVRRLTLDRFEEVLAAASGGFMRMGEEVLEVSWKMMSSVQAGKSQCLRRWWDG
jgi:hypothetical protein